MAVRSSRLFSLVVLAVVLVGRLAGAAPAKADIPYSIQVVAPPAKKAARATVIVHIAPGSGYHMNKDYPTTAKVLPLAGVTVDKAAVRVEEAGCDIEIPFTAAEAGNKDFVGELRFAVCTATSCAPQRATLAVTVEVK